MRKFDYRRKNVGNQLSLKSTFYCIGFDWKLVITCGHCPDKHVKVDRYLQEGCLNLTGGSFSNQLNRLLYQVGGGVVVVDERKHLLLQHQRILSTGLDFTMITIVYGQVWSLTQKI